eukprot:365310-Chlamydomonas_euryale.AAC.11
MIGRGVATNFSKFRRGFKQQKKEVLKGGLPDAVVWAQNVTGLLTAPACPRLNRQVTVGASNMVTAMVGAGYTGSYIFSQVRRRRRCGRRLWCRCRAGVGAGYQPMQQWTALPSAQASATACAISILPFIRSPIKVVHECFCAQQHISQERHVAPSRTGPRAVQIPTQPRSQHSPDPNTVQIPTQFGDKFHSVPKTLRRRKRLEAFEYDNLYQVEI